jgi:hypothetical protein
MDGDDGAFSKTGKLNGWKVAFFVMLILFEVAREAAVLAGSRGAVPNGTAVVSSYEGSATAKGRWTRLDGGSRLMPAVVTIDCRQDLGRCVEASTIISNEYVYSPEIDWFDARFGDDAITYENDVPNCARYLVRIDLKLKKTFAVRERKDNPANPTCAKLEPRVEMQLGEPYEQSADPSNGHFVPFFWLIRSILN